MLNVSASALVCLNGKSTSLILELEATPLHMTMTLLQQSVQRSLYCLNLFPELLIFVFSR